jgi:hypothetical protein
MARIKLVFAALLVAAIVGMVPQTQAQTIKVVLAGSSALWQSMALAAYKSGTCVSGGTPPCHYSKELQPSDGRPTTKGAAARGGSRQCGSSGIARYRQRVGLIKVDSAVEIDAFRSTPLPCTRRSRLRNLSPGPSG